MREIWLILAGLCLGRVLYYFRIGAGFESWFSRVANRRSLAVAFSAAVAMLPRLALLPWLPPPSPNIQDEFSLVLGAQTFALGRITNPAHPFWQHFESFHINVVPTYQTMYAPAPSLFMALGIVFGRNPWWGLWLTTGLMCAAICWALQPLIRPKYALVAGLLCAMKYGLFTPYGHPYWDGSVAALGGALTLGAFVRLKRTRRPWHVFVLVLGIALLANSRPMEGLLFAIPIAIGMALWLHRSRAYSRVLVPALAMLALVGVAWTYYNYRSTGHALLMPYVENFHEYHFVKPIVGTGMAPMPHYRHYEMARLYRDWEGKPGELAQTPKGFGSLTVKKFQYYYRVHFVPLMILAIAGFCYTLRSRRRWELSTTFALVCVGLFAVVFFPLPSYPAPLLVSFFGLALLGLRRLRALRFRRVGYYGARGVVLVLFVTAALNFGHAVRENTRAIGVFPPAWNTEREHLIHALKQSRGEHVVLVQYSQSHPVHQEWVYNSPNIDDQQVILARAMGKVEDCELMRYYPKRRIWYLYPDGAPWPQLVSVDPSSMCSGTSRPVEPGVALASK
ncbi:MAG TPA: hypothetical protein VFM10_07140 [Terriglobales bacterium]|jgi:hypothetical protein|nr:hypothetical protein [Terriglobales bacterium]